MREYCSLFRQCVYLAWPEIFDNRISSRLFLHNLDVLISNLSDNKLGKLGKQIWPPKPHFSIFLLSINAQFWFLHDLELINLSDMFLDKKVTTNTQLGTCFLRLNYYYKKNNT